MTAAKRLGCARPELSFVKKQNPLQLLRSCRTVERASRSRIRETGLMSYTSRFVGIDISKSSLDICVLPDGQTATYQNTPAGIADFLTFVVCVEGIERLVLEPTAVTNALSLPPCRAHDCRLPRSMRSRSDSLRVPVASSPRPTRSMPSFLPIMQGAWKQEFCRNALLKSELWRILSVVTDNCRT
ncbi:hypothetical protein BR10RB9215_C20745 [Brucella sp. 10RB9215]|nr:hypothetical protein BR10RB9215_C20745 [Brucella sp. 10RB9215]